MDHDPAQRSPSLSVLGPAPSGDVVGIDRVVFGTDFSYLRRDIALRCREDIEASPKLTDSEQKAVLGATAMTLIPRLATLRSQTQTHAS